VLAAEFIRDLLAAAAQDFRVGAVPSVCGPPPPTSKHIMTPIYCMARHYKALTLRVERLPLKFWVYRSLPVVGIFWWRGWRWPIQGRPMVETSLDSLDMDSALEPCGGLCYVQLGIVQTAYANGASSNYIR
jgi:hypothetical protein